MKIEEIKKIIDSFNQRYPNGSISLELVNFENNNLRVKFNCADKTEFKVQGKIVTMAGESKKLAEKYLKEKLSIPAGKNIKIIFI